MCIILRELLLTTEQTTYRSGALGNSGHKSTEECGFPSGKGRKKPFSTESAIINAFEGKVPKSEVTDMVEIKEPINKYLKAPDDWNF